MGYSAALTVVPRPPRGFETAFPALASQPQADADTAGIVNGLPAPNQGNGPQQSFTGPITPGQKSFMRLRVSQQ
jgi:hypothetical protein